MNTSHTFSRVRARASQAGFTLVELMVAMAIGLVVLLGMTATFVNLKSTFRSQDQLGQLQDNERLAMSILTTALNEAGYFPDAKSASPITGSSPASGIGGTMADRQAVFGTAADSSTATSESLSTAFASVNGDGLMSCLGTTNSGPSTPVTVRNIFFVDSATSTLRCKVLVDGGVSATMANGGTEQELISGVTAMSVLYGVDTNANGGIDTYIDPATMTTAQWLSVKGVRVSLTFTNPFGGAPIVRTHYINLMN